jgi:hypothetical protein
MPPRRPTEKAAADQAVARARVIARLREKRLTARATILKKWERDQQLLYAKLNGWRHAHGLPVRTAKADDDKRQLRFLCQAIVDDPRIVVESLWAPLIFRLARAYLEQLPEPLSQQETADLIDKMVDGGMDIQPARVEVAVIVGRSVDAVSKTHQRLGRHKGRPGRRKRDK